MEISKRDLSMLSVSQYENLIDIQSLSFVIHKFELGPRNNFWMDLQNEYFTILFDFCLSRLIDAKLAF